MTALEVQKRCLEIDVLRAQLRCEHANAHYQRLLAVEAKSRGAVSQQEMDDSLLALGLARLDVEECEVKLQDDIYIGVK